MPRADKLCSGFPRDLDEVFLERDSFVLRLQAQATSDEDVAISDSGGERCGFLPTLRPFAEARFRPAGRLDEQSAGERGEYLSMSPPLHLRLVPSRSAH